MKQARESVCFTVVHFNFCPNYHSTKACQLVKWLNLFPCSHDLSFDFKSCFSKSASQQESGPDFVNKEKKLLVNFSLTCLVNKEKKLLVNFSLRCLTFSGTVRRMPLIVSGALSEGRCRLLTALVFSVSFFFEDQLTRVQ